MNVRSAISLYLGESTFRVMLNLLEAQDGHTVLERHPSDTDRLEGIGESAEFCATRQRDGANQWLSLPGRLITETPSPS